MSADPVDRVLCGACGSLVPLPLAYPGSPDPDSDPVCLACGPQARQLVDLAHDVAILEDENRRLRREIAELGERVVTQAVELGARRETIARLNRRAQAAEAGVYEATTRGVNPPGWCFGRSLANAAARMYHDRLDVAMAALVPIAHEVKAIRRARAPIPTAEECWALCLVAAAAADQVRRMEPGLAAPV